MDGAISRSGRVAFVLFVCVLLVVSPVAGVATPPGGQAQQSLSATGVSAQTSSDGTSSSTAPICSEVAYEGDGTESTPYEITNVSQLQCIESQGLDAHYVLTADIDASVTSKWNNGNGFDPIGENDTYSFTGSLDGTNHSISNLTINRSSEETVGLFGAMGPGGGTVENLALSGVSVVGYGRVGAVAGDMWGGTTISEVSVSGSIFGDGSKIGGIAGRSYGVIERSYSTADVTGFSSVGGVAGETIEEITASYATGTITGSSSVGGIVGQNNFGTVSASYWDINETDQTTSAGGTGLTTMEMVGTDARENMDGFGFGTTWRATSSYPRFAWQTAPVNGTLSAANGASLSGGSIGIFTITDEDEIEGIDTDVGENGTFRIDGGFPDTTYMVAFGDDDAGTTSNGVPDLYAVDRVSPPADLGTVTIPEAHNVTVRVTDREGEPIQGADVALEHTNGDAVVKEGERNATNENGYLTIDGDNSLELVGNVTVGAEYRGVNNTTNVEALSNDREITVQLTRPDVTGNLSAANGASLKNDSIGLYRPTSDGTEVIDTTVNEDGNFTIRGASADRNYSLAFGDTNGTDSSNGVPDLYAIDIVSPPADVGEIDIPEAHNVSVRVVDQDGSPIESAGVAIEHTNGDAGIFEGGDDLTNETGYLSVDGSTSFEFVGNLTVGARYRGVVNATNVTVDEDKDITVELSGYEVNGTVTDANNDPVPNGSVTYDAFDEEREQFWQRTTTTEAGAYQTHLFPADYQIRFRQSEGDRYPLDGVPDIYTADSVFVDGPTQNDIALPEAHQLQIQVVSGTQPLADETVELTHLNESGGTGIEAETNSTGWVQLGGTSGVEVVGEIAIELESERYYAETSRTVDANDTVVLEAQELVNVTGNVTTAEGNAVTDGEVFARAPEGSMSADAPIDESGEFELALARNTTYELGFRQDGAGTEADLPEDGVPDIQSLTRIETGTDDVRLPTQRLGVGHPFDITVKYPDGSNASGVNVYVSDNNIEEDFALGLGGETNENGSLVLYGAEEPGIEVNGSIDVYVDTPEDSGLADANRRDVVVDEPGSITIQLEPAASVNGTILKPDGETPAAGERVQVNPDGDGIGDTVTTDENGFFDAQVPATGAYYVGFAQGDAGSEIQPPYPNDGVPDVYAIANVTSDEEADLGTVTLPEPHNVTVNVVDPEGELVEGATVRLWSTANDAYQWGGETTLESGNFTAELNGSVDIQVFAPERTDLRDEYERIEVDSDDTVNITLDRNVSVSGSVDYWNGDNASEYTMELFGNGGDDRLTNETGHFELYPEPNQFYALGFKQTDWEGDQPNFPKDGRPDLHTFGAIEVENEDRNVDDLTLPSAHLVNITVENESGDPISDADVDLNVLAGSFGVHHPATTRDDGEVALAGSSTPGVEVNGTLRVSVAGTDEYAQNVTEFEVDEDRDVTLVVRDRVNVTGQLVNESGSDLGGYDVLVGQGETSFVSEQVNETGAFAVPVGTNQNYSVTAGQIEGDQEIIAPRDGLTDFYQLAIVKVGDDDYSLDEQTVPDSNGVLNVSVENESGRSVENALVTVVPTQTGAPDPSSAGITRLTDDEGYFAVNDRPGIEAAGNYTIRVERPPNADRFVDETYVRTVNVTGDETVEVTLNETEAVGESDLNLQNIALADDEITVGEDVVIDVTVENRGDATGSTTVELRSGDGTITASETVSVDAGNSTPVELRATVDAADEYDLTVTGAGSSEDIGTLNVTESDDSDSSDPTEPIGSSNVSIVDTTLSEKEITAGEDVLINVTLNNTADKERAINVSFFKDDEVFHEQQYNVSANTNRTVSLSRTIKDAGTSNISVQNDDINERYDVGTVTVNEDDETSSEMPGFGVVPAIAALIGALGILRRRH